MPLMLMPPLLSMESVLGYVYGAVAALLSAYAVLWYTNPVCGNGLCFLR